MNSYHVFVSAKDGVSAEFLEEKMKTFLDSQIEGNHMYGYRILRFSNKASFEGMPDYQIICHYESENKMNEAFSQMRPDRWKEEPHAGMLNLVEDFRVCFSDDIAESRNPDKPVS